jgi:hypothetical protein
MLAYNAARAAESKPVHRIYTDCCTHPSELTKYEDSPNKDANRGRETNISIISQCKSQ